MVYNKIAIDVLQTEEFRKWMKRLRDADAKARINLRIRRIQLTGNLGDVKPVGEGVFELRVDYGPGFRIYFSMRGDAVILLLVGGDKSTQVRDIKRAKAIDRAYDRAGC